MKSLNPEKDEFVLICDICNKFSGIIPARDEIIKQGEITKWGHYFDPNHPSDWPHYHSCPSCPEKKLLEIARDKRAIAQKQINEYKMEEKP